VGEPYARRCSECDAAARRATRVATLSSLLDTRRIAELSYLSAADGDLDEYTEAWQIAHDREQKEAMSR
jgi:hypothetical protein